MITTELILRLQQLTSRDDLSVTHFDFALRVCADFICMYTNRRVLSPGVENLWVAMACDYINYCIPSDIGAAVPTSIEMDDTKIQGQVNLLNMPNVEFMRNYRRLLERYRVMPRYREPWFEPIRRYSKL